ncbi:MFS transporter [Kribbella turkmenica]|uniref:MFS transporter n=1 Tax=Kribbella turkmenica TaxID=2530375 RepID=A0A4R4X914_9ACTN|nr:MFS transporter [Kribbella turkmenica]TDD26819.1 MFS transporter [Kribbella turkmenica]
MNHIARLERLPMGRPHRKLLVIGGLGYTFDAADAAVIAFILPVVSKQWGLNSGEVSLLASSLLVGYLFGALAAGVLGDRFGRKKVMIGSLIVYTLMTAAAAFSPNFEALFAFRVLAGVGIGAESAIIAPYLAEFVPGRYRGRFIGSVAGFFAFGYVLCAVLSRIVIPTGPDGWRVVQLILVVPIVMVIWWRRALPESPRYLLAKGREDEANRIVSAFEAAVRADTGRDLPPLPASDSTYHPVDVELARRSIGAKLATLWTPRFVRRTTVTWVSWFAITFAYYGFFTMMPKLLADQGLTITKSFTFAIYIYIAQIPGYFSAAFLSDALDRKRVIALYLVGATASAVLLSQAQTNWQIIACGAALSLFMTGTYAVLYTYTPEVYPTEIRTTGQGAASAFGRVGGIAAPFAFTAAAVHGFGSVFILTAAVLAVCVITVMTLGLPTQGKTLEEISPPSSSPAEQRSTPESEPLR